MSMQMMTPALRKHTDERKARLIRMSRNAMADRGIPLKAVPPVQRVIARFRDSWPPKPNDIAARLVLCPVGLRIRTKFGELWHARSWANETVAIEAFHFSATNPWAPSIDTIIRAVCLNYKISGTDLRSDRRLQRIVWPRQIGMWLCRTLTLRSTVEIGKRFGGRDHTTVIHAVRKIDGLRLNDPALAYELDEMKAQILARLPVTPGLE